MELKSLKNYSSEGVNHIFMEIRWCKYKVHVKGPTLWWCKALFSHLSRSVNCAKYFWMSKYFPDPLFIICITALILCQAGAKVQVFFLIFEVFLCVFKTDCGCVKWCSWKAITVCGEKWCANNRGLLYKYACLCSICLVHFPEVQYLAKP